MTTKVKGHVRRDKRGKTTWIKSHIRRSKKLRDVPVIANNPSIKRAEAQYDPASKSTLLTFVDEDPDRINFIMQEIPVEAKKIEIDEQGHLGLTIQSRGKKKTETTVIIEQPKDF